MTWLADPIPITMTGLHSLGMAVLSTHQLKSTPRLAQIAAATESRSSVGILPTLDERTSKTDGNQANLPEKKVKVASLMQPAQTNSSQQAEMTFDVNSFNF